MPKEFQQTGPATLEVFMLIFCFMYMTYSGNFVLFYVFSL